MVVIVPGQELLYFEREFLQGGSGGWEWRWGRCSGDRSTEKVKFPYHQIKCQVRSLAAISNPSRKAIDNSFGATLLSARIILLHIEFCISV